MDNGIRFPLILALVFYLFTPSFEEPIPQVVHIIDAMGAHSSPINVQCNVNGNEVLHAVLQPGQDYQWAVEANDVYSCQAIWRKSFATWLAYEPKRDAGHVAIFWKVNEDGLFLSWDKSSWVKKAIWETA